MIYGLILAAGNQSRFSSDIPKALMPINADTNLLDLNIRAMSPHVDDMFVVCSHNNEKYFASYKSIVINSGRGCGDAVLVALDNLPLREEDTVFIQWGDSYQPPSIYEKIKSFYKGTVVIPCQIEDSPYVQIIPVENNVRVIFSKYGEQVTRGFHDLSIFYGNALAIREHLRQFKDKIEVNGVYHHKHNNELQFLDVFNETSLSSSVLPINDYKGISFNTTEEFNSQLGRLVEFC